MPQPSVNRVETVKQPGVRAVMERQDPHHAAAFNLQFIGSEVAKVFMLEAFAFLATAEGIWYGIEKIQKPEDT